MVIERRLLLDESLDKSSQQSTMMAWTFPTETTMHMLNRLLVQTEPANWKHCFENFKFWTFNEGGDQATNNQWTSFENFC